MIKVIVFDVGGVFILSPGYINFIKGKLELDENQLARMKRLYHKAEKGEMNFSQLKSALSKEFEMDEYYLDWPDINKAKLNKDVKRLVIKLSKRYKVVLLTNMIKDRYLRLVKHGIIEKELFHNIFVSADIGMLKPDFNIYRFVLRKLDVNAEEVIFVDDKLSNVEAARALGINAIQYTDYKLLENELKKFDVEW